MKDDVFLLVKSLSKSERIYFKKYAFMQKSANSKAYFLMFDLLAQQEIYDEKAIKEKLKHTPLYNNFSVAKNYLYQLILDLAVQFDKNKISVKLEQDLMKLNFLIRRNLESQAKEHIKNIKKIIFKYELFEYYNVLYNIEFGLQKYNLDDAANIKLLALEKEMVDNKLYHHFKIDYDKYQVWINRFHNTQVFLRTEKQIEETKLLLIDSMDNMNEHLMLKSVVQLYQIKIFTLMGLDEASIHEAYDTSIKLLHLLEKQRNKLQINALFYIVVFKNIIRTIGMVQDYTYFHDVVKEIRLLLQHIEHERSKNEMEFEFIITELNIHYHNKNLKAVKENLKNINPFIDNVYKDNIHTLVLVYFDLALFHFYTDDFEQALNYVNLIFNQKNIETKQTIKSYTEILRLLILIESDTFLTSENYYYNLKKKIYRDGCLFKCENAILNFIEEYIYTNEKKILVLAKHQKIINDILQDSYENNFLKYVRIDWWLAAKIQDKTIYQYFTTTKIIHN